MNRAQHKRVRAAAGSRLRVAAATAVCVGTVGLGLAGPAAGGEMDCSDKASDMQIALGAEPAGPYAAGDAVTLTAVVSNLAPCPAPHVQTGITLPDGLNATGDRSWTEDFAKDESKSHQLEATIEEPGEHIVRATASAGKFGDPDLTNNSDELTLVAADDSEPTTTTTTTTQTTTETTTETTTTTTPTTTTTIRANDKQQADLAIETAIDPAKPLYDVGEAISLEVRAVNLGPFPAPQARIALELPSGLSAGDVSVSDGTYDAQTGIWQLDLGQGGDPENPGAESLTVSLTTAAEGNHAIRASRVGGHFDDRNAANDTSAADVTVSSNDPVEGKAINAVQTTGTVLVQLPGQPPRPINPDGELLPPGVVIDATGGKVKLTSDFNGVLEQMKFWAGAFKLGQKISDEPVVNVKLVKSLGESVIERPRGVLLRKRGTRGKRLWGSGSKGHYRTRGRSGSATVRGTKWQTVDRPNRSTKFRLSRGRLEIDDFSKRGKIDKILEGRGVYIAKPAKPNLRRGG